MAEWTQIPDATFDTDRPILGSTHLAIVRNFEAMAEGANNAPRVQSVALTNSVLASFSASDESLSQIEFLNLPDVSAFYVEVESLQVSGGAASLTLQAQCSADNGVSFSDWIAVNLFEAPGPAFVLGSIGFPVHIPSYGGRLIDALNVATSFTGPINAIRVRVPGRNIINVTNLNVVASFRGYE